MRFGFHAPAVVLLLALAWVLGRGGTGEPPPPPERVLEDLRLLEDRALVYVPAYRGPKPFLVDRYEVTNGRFLRFLADTGYRPAEPGAFLAHLVRPLPAPEGLALRRRDEPVVFVSLADARAYARFAGGRLPTLEEWRAVARSVTISSRFDANVAETGLRRPARVGTFEGGATGSGDLVAPRVYDLYGNVAEWTETPGREVAGTYAVIGRSFTAPLEALRRRPTRLEEPTNRNFALGFRVVVPDAAELIDRLVLWARTGGGEAAEAARAALERFGTPARRVVERLRFEHRSTPLATAPAAPRSLLPATDGGVFLVSGDGTVARFDAAGAQVARGSLGRRILRSWSGSGDRTGGELYLLSLSEDGDAAARPSLLLVASRRGGLVLLDPRRGLEVPWTTGTLDEEVPLRDELALDEVRRLVSGALPAPLSPCDPRGAGAVVGVVLRAPRFLSRVVLSESGVRELWRREVSRVDDLLVDARRGEICLLQRLSVRFGASLESSEESANVLEAVVLDRESGAPLARGRVPGVLSRAAWLDEGRGDLVLVTTSGRALRLVRRGSAFEVGALRRRASEAFCEEAVPLGGGDVALLLHERPARGVAGGWVLEVLDRNARRRALRRFAERRDEVPVLRFAEGADLLLVARSDGVLEGFDRALRLRFARRVARLDLERGHPCGVESGAGLALAVAWGYDGLQFLDPVDGRPLHRLREPGAVLVDWVRGGKGVLWVDLGELGVRRFLCRGDERDREWEAWWERTVATR